jgi:DNA replicative helicase MCM subunit Mcm2 (Cdc46/Mcm family)
MVTAEKVEDTGNKRGNTLLLHDSKSWYLEEKNISDMLPLIEMDAKSNMVHGLLKRYMGIPANEEGLDMKLQSYKTVYKVVAIDKDVDSSSASLDVYSFQKLDVGGQYRITYRLYAHPTKNQKIVGIIDNLVNLGDKSDFKADPAKLKMFQRTGTIQERLDYLYQSAKHHIAKHLDFDLWLTLELVFNSVLEIDYAGPMRGALDVFILGDTQVGKSEASSALTHLYNFGHFLSLKTSTTEGLIGGSNMVGGSYINTVGAIPRQHTKLVVMEEFSGARKDFIKKMTEIRSSGTLRLVRVAGEMIIPCRLRMITISNPINDDNGNPRFLGSFPNGVIPIMELITSAEDVARYDGFLLVPKRENRLNPFAYELVGEPIAKEYYEHKANWVMTRQMNQVIYAPGVEKYIWEKGEELNTHFECNFPMFGTTTPKKLARFVVALASLLVNVDETYEKIIVTKEMVDFMVEHLMRTYTAPHFRLNDYKEEYDSYHSFTDADVKELQKLYVANSVLFDYLSKQSATSRNDIAAVSGLDRDLFGPIFNKLVSHKFLRMTRDTIFPTEKFRKVYRALDKTKRLDTASPQIGGEANGA